MNSSHRKCSRLDLTQHQTFNNVSEEGRLQMLIKELCDGRHMTIRPKAIEVFMVLNAPQGHPPKIGDIRWSCLNEEMWRLHTFVTYPEDAAKAAILLARNGFAYIGSGKGRDDLVICFSCCLQKNGWAKDENIGEVHARLSPDCPMVTGRDCINVPFVVPANSESLIANQTAKYACMSRGNKAPTAKEPLPDNMRNNSNVPSQGSDIQSHHTPAIQQPYSESARYESASLCNITVDVSTTACSQHTQNDAHSHTVPSSTAALSLSAFPTPPAQNGNGTTNQRANIRQPHTTRTPAALPNTRPAREGQACSQLQFRTARSSENVAAATNMSFPHAAASFGAATAAPTRSSNTTATVHATQNANNSTASNTQDGNSSSASGGEGSADTSAKSQKRCPTYQELGIITEKPKRFEYAQRATRYDTFANWHRDHYLNKDDLTDAGFYFTGHGDCVRCFYCGGGLQDWEKGDDIWVEHARWFPKCAFIRLQMGQRFVDTVQELNMEQDQISFDIVAQKMGVPTSVFRIITSETQLRRYPAVRTVVNMGFKEEDVLETAKRVNETDGTLSADVLFEKLLEAGKTKEHTQASQQTAVAMAGSAQDAKETLHTLQEQNALLRQKAICIICKDKAVAIVFLPCGHLVSCLDCACAVKDCPVCGENVKSIILHLNSYLLTQSRRDN